MDSTSQCLSPGHLVWDLILSLLGACDRSPIFGQSCRGLVPDHISAPFILFDVVSL